MDVNMIISLHNVNFYYGQSRALNDITMDFLEKKVTALIGPSGCGKSTLLRAINLLEEIEEGAIIFEGREVGYVMSKGKRHLDHPRAISALRAEIGMVFQHFHLFPHMTVLGNVMEGPLTVQGKSADEARSIATDMLVKVGLSDKRDVFPATLSGGQKQRVAIARALAMRPKLMLFDEPTSALDPELVGEVFDTIHTLADEGMTMIIVTHHMGFARELADRVIFMESGNFLAQGTPEELFSAGQDNERIRGFLNRLL